MTDAPQTQPTPAHRTPDNIATSPAVQRPPRYVTNRGPAPVVAPFINLTNPTTGYAMRIAPAQIASYYQQGEEHGTAAPTTMIILTSDARLTVSESPEQIDTLVRDHLAAGNPAARRF